MSRGGELTHEKRHITHLGPHWLAKLPCSWLRSLHSSVDTEKSHEDPYNFHSKDFAVEDYANLSWNLKSKAVSPVSG
ncbi:hypothetical protein Tco_0154941 [Tanacetum coccineum]